MGITNKPTLLVRCAQTQYTFRVAVMQIVCTSHLLKQAVRKAALHQRA